MELILKLRSSCNFACTFCSASNIKVNNDIDIPQQIKDILRVLQVNGLIITGGEPLTVPPEYLEKLIGLAGSQCKNISLTTNLKDFYLNPDKWTDFFKRDDVGICTSFNYGGTRMWDKDTIYSENMFIDVMNLFKQRIGYMPPFISVISNENDDTAMNNIYLAKRLGTSCRLNNAFKVGRQSTHYPRYKMFKFYLKIIEEGIEEFEINTKDRSIGRCAYNTNGYCQSAIRAAYVDIDGKLHYASCEDVLNSLSLDLEIPIDDKRPDLISISPPYNNLITDKCMTCELYRLCNGCRSQREQSKTVPEHCEEMSRMKKQIIDAGWKL
jgi:sulfatase maturation enzyme AslB (radical SAM superfamily)